MSVGAPALADALPLQQQSFQPDTTTLLDHRTGLGVRLLQEAERIYAGGKLFGAVCG